MLTLALLLGVVVHAGLALGPQDGVLLLGWVVLATLLMAGRQFFGWRGWRATRWLAAGSVLLLLAYGLALRAGGLLQRLPA